MPQMSLRGLSDNFRDIAMLCETFFISVFFLVKLSLKKAREQIR